MSGKYLLANMLSAFGNKNYFYDNPVVVEYNKVCEMVLNIAKQAGYVKDYNVVESDGKKNIEVWLKIIAGKKVINDFKGFSKKSFDAHNNFAFGIKDHLIFNELSYDTIVKSRGLNIMITIKNAVSKEQACDLLNGFEFPVK